MSALPQFDDLGQRNLTRAEQIKQAGLRLKAAALRRQAHLLDVAHALIDMAAGDDCAALSVKHSQGYALEETATIIRCRAELLRLTGPCA